MGVRAGKGEGLVPSASSLARQAIDARDKARRIKFRAAGEQTHLHIK